MKVLGLFLALLLLFPNLPILNTATTVNGADGRQNYFEFHFEDDDLQVLNNTKITTVLTIRIIGSSFFGELFFNCPKDFDCPITVIHNISFSPGVEVRENFTFVARLNRSFIISESIQANLENKSIFIDETTWLRVTVIFPVSFEITNNWAQCSYSKVSYGNPYGNPYEYYSLDCRGYRPDKQNISLELKITNHDENTSLKGFIGCSGIFFLAQNIFPFILFNETAISISPKSSKIINILLPKPIDESWFMTSIEQIVFKFNKSSNQGEFPNMNMKSSPPKRMEFGMSIYLFSRIGFWIDAPSEDQQDIWNGTNITVHVYNAMDTPLRSEYAIIEDKVEPYTSFEYEKYMNSTIIQLGDIAALTEKQVNCTIYSKASGTHYFSARLGSDSKIRTRFDSKISIASGLNITYIGYDLGLMTIPSRRVEIHETTNITMRINNPRGYEGDVSLSIHLIGWERQLDKVNGNGWLDESEFVDIEPKSIRLKSVNQTVFFKIVPKISGEIYLIPFLEVKGILLIFDENTAEQVWTRPCGNYNEQSEHPALPGICSGYSYDHLQTYAYKGVKQLNYLVYGCCAISIVITIAAYFRRFRLQSKYRKIIDRRSKAMQQLAQPKKKRRKST
jgi:hypothetical protein